MSWTTRPGDDYSDLAELYGETLGMWGLYMGHVTSVIGGVQVDAKVSEQPGAVYTPVSKARQKAALAFLADNALRTPDWLAPNDILSRIGPQTGGASLAARQSNVVTQLLDARRLDRITLGQEMLDAASAYSLPEYLGDVRRALLGWRGQHARRQSARAAARVPRAARGAAVTAAGAAGESGLRRRWRWASASRRSLPPPNVRRSDISALARAELRAVRETARTSATTATGINRAHWQDMAERVDEILEKQKDR